MQGSGQEEEEGDGDVVMPDATDDSSEEGEDDEEEERRIREGFIVDEDEDEEEEEEEEAPRKRKRRKREEETLEEDDLQLLEENTGGNFKRKSRLTRLRRRDSASPPAASSSRRREVVESSEDDLDNEGSRQAPDIRNIWDDDRRGDDEDDEMSDFIEYSDEEEGGVAMNEEAREARREEKRQEQVRRKKARGARPELAGIDANAWDEIHEVFGDGHEYDWALIGDDEGEYEEDHFKSEMKYQDVFEPSEIRKRMLTEDDDLIRAQDIPERMQLANSSLAQSSTLSMHRKLTDDELGGAAMWVTTRLSTRKNRDFFSPDGIYQHLKGALVMAVTFALRQIFIEEYEVPYIWAHKRDHISHFDVHDIRSRFELLSLNELWRINSLGQKYRSLTERRKALTASYSRLQIKDEYYEDEIQEQIDSVEVVADATEWLSMKYKDQKEDAVADFRFHDDEEPEVKKRKMPSRISAYEVTKKSIVSKLAQGFGIAPHQVVLNFLASHHVHFIDDQEVVPLAYAEQYEDSDPTKAQSPEELLRKARMILATELGKDPLLRIQIRKLFKEEARVTVEPTERGITKIDENHPYFNFKYLYQKHVNEMLDSAQFLHILAAEAEHLVTVTVSIPADVKSTFERKLLDAFSSDNFSEAAKAWNAERSRVIREVMEQHLLPAGTKWAREYIREEVEDCLALRCSDELRSRIDVGPYLTRELRYGEFASSVLAISWGKGDPHKDPITLVFVDEAGRMREHTKIDNLHDQDNKDEFIDLVKRRKPDVAVIGGFTIATLKLMHLVKQLFGGDLGVPDEHGRDTNNEQAFDIPAIYVQDDVARIYQHSKRAADEFSALPPTAKYCVGLARYVQSPLNEFAALGSDISAISFDEDNQHMIPKDKLLVAFEQVIVDITNKVGVDINRAVTDPYHQHLLPFVCGMGPRKAQVLVKKIASQGGTLVNRDQFIKGGLLTTKIFLNAVGFLRIIQDRDPKPLKYRPEDENAPDPLDDTRIHPEDYELARKMATDALELDEEDIHDEHPSHVVTLIMNDKEKDRKLLELNLDEFAISLYEANHDQKRHTLNVIREELQKPFSEKREKFRLPTDSAILTMLSGETSKTLTIGLIVSALVFRISRESVIVRLDSGIEATIDADLLTDSSQNPYDVVKKGQTLTAIVIETRFDLDHDEVSIKLSTRPKDLADGDRDFRRVPYDKYWDHARYSKDQEMLARKKRAETDRTRRVIKHPNFHNFNTAQSEAYLEKQQRGDVVIRPSSKGINHLAVTWKVDEKLYQHIDVTELNGDPTGQTVGGQLVVDATHTYADLDELIVNHVQAMARRVEELMAHEKFKHGSEDELHLFLKNFLAANPAKSMYGFTLNRKRPGHLSLCFLANKNSTVQTWPIRVAPEAYYLFDAAAVGVPELCDAFKVR
ncbi:transcription elongation factor SPT6 [Crassisporium funariophilum]|nr:transcription elongation factor SPT6 [Crassisporium funariophilum]